MKMIHLPADDHVHWKFKQIMEHWGCSNQAETFEKMVDECYVPIKEGKRDE